MTINETEGRPVVNIEVTAKSAICVLTSEHVASAPRVLYEKDADSVIPPASITKLLTAVTAIRIANRSGIPVTYELEVVSGDDVNGSGRNVQEGDRFSFRDGMANLLLASSNVTANVIARTFGADIARGSDNMGSVAIEHFVSEMNTIARDLKMTKSRFHNPHGLAARGQRSTARDLSLLVEACLEYPLITELWGLDNYPMAIAGPNSRKVAVKSVFKTSTRRVVPDFDIPQFTGGKTGTLWPSLFSLAAVSEIHGRNRLISVTCGSPSLESRYLDYLKMVDIGSSVITADREIVGSIIP